MNKMKNCTIIISIILCKFKCDLIAMKLIVVRAMQLRQCQYQRGRVREFRSMKRWSLCTHCRGSCISVHAADKTQNITTRVMMRTGVGNSLFYFVNELYTIILILCDYVHTYRIPHTILPCTHQVRYLLSWL